MGSSAASVGYRAQARQEHGTELDELVLPGQLLSCLPHPGLASTSTPKPEGAQL